MKNDNVEIIKIRVCQPFGLNGKPRQISILRVNMYDRVKLGSRFHAYGILSLQLNMLQYF
jgi:hypothetical protein